MTQHIKTRRDGSIDTSHYIALGRQKRANTARELFQRSGNTAPRTARAGGGWITACACIAIVALTLPGLVS